MRPLATSRSPNSPVRVWVTRAKPAASATGIRLQALGHEAVIAPLLTVQRLRPLIDLDGVGALAFTSLNGVAAFADLTPHRTLPVFAVGDATAKAASSAGFQSVRSASGAVDDLIELIIAEHQPVSGRVLWASAVEAAGDLSAGLARHGLVVDRLPVYAVMHTPQPEALSALAAGAIDAVLVHSPRAARELAHGLSGEVLGGAAVCISDAAALPLRTKGLTPILVAESPNEASLLAALGKLGPPV